MHGPSEDRRELGETYGEIELRKIEPIYSNRSFKADVGVSNAEPQTGRIPTANFSLRGGVIFSHPPPLRLRRLPPSPTGYKHHTHQTHSRCDSSPIRTTQGRRWTTTHNSSKTRCDATRRRLRCVLMEGVCGSRAVACILLSFWNSFRKLLPTLDGDDPRCRHTASSSSHAGSRFLSHCAVVDLPFLRPTLPLTASCIPCIISHLDGAGRRPQLRYARYPSTLF